MAVSEHGTKPMLIEAIREAGCVGDFEKAADAILELLHRQRILTIRARSLQLLTPYGRVLADLANHPEATLRESCMRLGLTENNTKFLMTRLIAEGLVVRTRVGHRHHYSVDGLEVLTHSDSAALLGAVISLAKNLDTDKSDSTTIGTV
jgi:hypothetical protein